MLAERFDKLLQGAAWIAGLAEFDIQITQGDVRGDEVQTLPTGVNLEASDRLATLDQAAGLVALVALCSQIKAGGTLRVKIPK